MSEIRAGIKASEIGLYGLQRQATETDRAFGHCHMVNDHAVVSKVSNRAARQTLIQQQSYRGIGVRS
jgi:hypothetical protein|nr:hypothetical protein [Thiocapsa sp. KS1]